MGGWGKAALSCHCHPSYLWLKVSDQFSTIYKTHQLWPCCSSFGKVQSLNPYFYHLTWKSKISRRTEKHWVSEHSTYRKEAHQDLDFSEICKCRSPIAGLGMVSIPALFLVNFLLATVFLLLDLAFPSSSLPLPSQLCIWDDFGTCWQGAVLKINMVIFTRKTLQAAAPFWVIKI